MMMFPLWFVRILIYGSIGLCTVGAVTLLILLLIDFTKRRMW